MIRWQPVGADMPPTAPPPRRKPVADFEASVRAAPSASDAAARDAAATQRPPVEGRDELPRPATDSAARGDVRDARPAIPGEVSAAVADGDLALAAAHAASSAVSAAPVSLQLVAGGVVVEQLDLPWGLAATGRLAQLGRGEGTLAASAPAMPGTTGAVAHGAVSGAPFDPQTPVAMPAVVGSGRADAFVGATPYERRVRTGAMAIETAPPFATASAAEWTRQLLRAVERQGDLTLYVRDFRLDEAQVERLSEDLHAACSAAGRSVRIVVNGRVTRGPDTEARHAG